MIEQQSLLADTALRLCQDLAASRADGVPGRDGFRRRWQQVQDVGLDLLLVPEEQNGFGGTWDDAWVVLHLLGRYAIDLPLPEAILAARFSADAGLSAAPGLSTVATRCTGSVTIDATGKRLFSGRLLLVPWGRFSDTVVAVVGDGDRRTVIRVDTAKAVGVVERENAADEPRDAMAFESCPVEAADYPAASPPMRMLGALLRSAQIAGACRAALELSISYANDRTQFGRPIAKFQAIQHSLASLAAQIAAAETASRAACAKNPIFLRTASARIIANRAAEAAVITAHQVHGAIGFTWEYALHHLTRRLIAWQTEFGTTLDWSGALGTHAARGGPGGYWPMVVHDEG